MTVAVAVAVALTGACTAQPDTGARQRAAPTGGTGTPSSELSPSPTGVPSVAPVVERAEPWANRPVVSLRFDTSRRLDRATGRETVVFRPDQRVCELVFRLWPNKPETAAQGSSLAVTRAWVDGRPVRPRSRPATVYGPGARPAKPTPPTLLELPLRRCVDAGERVRARLDFVLALGKDASERVGYSRPEGMAWFATAFPMLAWERGRGWMRDPAVELFGEMAGSEDFRLRALDVVVRRGVETMGTGRRERSRPGPRGTVVHRFGAPAVRDVSVVVGDMDVLERTVGGVSVHVAGSTRGTERPLRLWLDRTTASLTNLTRLFGPYGYSDLWVTVVPDIDSGIEFPSAIQFGDVDPVAFAPLVSHEVAHMWFYGLVGNDQGRDPWLDESFATYAQALVDRDESAYLGVEVPAAAAGRLGEPMTYWARRPRSGELYGVGVYQQGGQALLRAREAAGAGVFDRAVRAYVDANAHRVTRPSDVRDALSGLPEALEELDRAGAFVRTG